MRSYIVVGSEGPDKFLCHFNRDTFELKFYTEDLAEAKNYAKELDGLFPYTSYEVFELVKV